MISKQHRLLFAKVTTRSKHILDLTHSDVGESLIDDYSRRLRVYPMKKKSYVFLVFKEFKAQVELETGKRIKILRENNGGKCVNGNFFVFCKQWCIVRQFSIPHTPQQNSVAEWMNKTLLDRTIFTLRTTKIAKSF